jgi:hypothetical protein
MGAMELVVSIDYNAMTTARDPATVILIIGNR